MRYNVVPRGLTGQPKGNIWAFTCLQCMRVGNGERGKCGSSAVVIKKKGRTNGIQPVEYITRDMHISGYSTIQTKRMQQTRVGGIRVLWIWIVGCRGVFFGFKETVALFASVQPRRKIYSFQRLYFQRVTFCERDLMNGRQSGNGSPILQRPFWTQ